MPFLLFQMPYLGNGMVIGFNAILHVVLSHGVAIGVVAMITLAEYLAVKKNREDWENFAQDLLKPTVIVITGVGAVTGVGIWFTTSALAPRGIGSMLRIFFWPWLIEWIVFTLEVIAVLIYYFKWGRWTGPQRGFRWSFGLLYVLLASGSAFLITGILGFMLTPDGWPWHQTLLSGFFNPSFVPQLLLRLGAAFALGSLFSIGFLLVTKRVAAFRKEAMSLYGKVFALSVFVVGFCAWWYFATVPSAFKTHALFAVLTSHFSQKPEIFWIMNAGGVFLLLLFFISTLSRSTLFSRLLILPALLAGIGFVSEYERMREFIRGPYLIPGYMYANQVLLKESLFLKKNGMLNNAYWFDMTLGSPTEASEGAFLFAQNCSMCHTIGGINDIRDRVRERTEMGIAVIVNHINDMVPFMPPFSGTNQEAQVLASFLHRLSQKKFPLEGSPSRFEPYERGGESG